MEIGTILLATIIIVISAVINYLQFKYIIVNQIVDETKHISNHIDNNTDLDANVLKKDEPIINRERISGNIEEITNNFTIFFEALGTDYFTEDITIYINKIVYEKDDNFINITYDDINKMDITEVYSFLLKMIRYYRNDMEIIYSTDLEHTIEYKIKKSETNVIKMRESLWNMILDIRNHLKNDKDVIINNAMSMMNEIFNKGFLDPNQNLIKVAAGGSGLIVSEVIEPVVLSLSDKDQSILDEINEINNVELKAADVEITELEKKMEASGMI